MKNEFQDLEWIVPKVTKLFTKNPNRSISATFRFCRRHPRLSSVGCYPILSTIIRSVKILKITISREKALYGLNQSEELIEFSKKDKNELLDELIKPLSVEVKTGRNGRRITYFYKSNRSYR